MTPTREARYEDERALQGKIEEIFDRGIIQAEALNFLRGRSIEKTYLIIDEAQKHDSPDRPRGLLPGQEGTPRSSFWEIRGRSTVPSWMSGPMG